MDWQLTAWRMDGNGGWAQQPIITAKAQKPFFADHPDLYVEKLQEMHDDPLFARGPFYTLIGKLKDSADHAWDLRLATVGKELLA